MTTFTDLAPTATDAAGIVGGAFLAITDPIVLPGGATIFPHVVID
ncbi:MAG: hypothetical protein NTV23_10205 [Propionibacteriales bacterium]|nr:hypothetical protein [Propionibacteriales bacterium]